MPGINLNNSESLVRLSEARELERTNAVDYRGKDVVDKHGRDIGEVKDVFVDQRERRTRFLEVASGGFLGIGRKTFLVPVDAVSNINEDKVTIKQEQSLLTKAPDFDPSTLDDRFIDETFSFYGATPYWREGYQYPTFPPIAGRP